jgi:hypothetical protein
VILRNRVSESRLSSLPVYVLMNMPFANECRIASKGSCVIGRCHVQFNILAQSGLQIALKAQNGNLKKNDSNEF